MIPLSIITINLNNGEGLEKTILSVLKQRFSSYEYIIIDGGSTDSSKEVLDKYKSSFSHCVVEPDTGIYNAMNKGIRLSKGNYCLFLNSGDTLVDEEVLSSIFDYPISEDILYGDILFEGETIPFTFPDVLTLSTFMGSSIGHNASFIRRVLFDSLGLYDETNRIVSDLQFFMLAIIKEKYSYKHINRVVTKNQYGGISMSKHYYAMQLEERKSALKKIFPECYEVLLEKMNMEEEIKYYNNSGLIQLAKKIQNNSIYTKAKKIFFRSK